MKTIYPQYSYFFKKALRIYFIWFGVVLLLTIFYTVIVYPSTVIHMFTSFKQVFLCNPCSWLELAARQAEYGFLWFHISIAFSISLFPLIMSFGFLYLLVRKKIKIVMDGNLITSYFEKKSNSILLTDLQNVETTWLSYKIKKGKPNTLIILFLYNKEFVQDTIDKYKNELKL